MQGDAFGPCRLPAETGQYGHPPIHDCALIEFLLTFAILLLIVTGMAVGVLRGRKPISGTCGGLNQLGVDGACEICGGRPELCEESGDSNRPAKADLATRLMR